MILLLRALGDSSMPKGKRFSMLGCSEMGESSDEEIDDGVIVWGGDASCLLTQTRNRDTVNIGKGE